MKHLKPNSNEAIDLTNLWIAGNDVFHSEIPPSIKLHFHYQSLNKIVVEDSNGKLLLIKYILTKD